MKKKSGLKRAVPIVSVDELRQLNTGALLARLQRLRFCEESREKSDLRGRLIIGAILYIKALSVKSKFM